VDGAEQIAPGTQHPTQFIEPEPLPFQRNMREDRQRKYEIEGPVGKGERRLQRVVVELDPG
jgi:hypothetical protein